MTPGIYIEEVATGPRPIQAVGTSTAGFVGVAPDKRAHADDGAPVAIYDWSQFLREFSKEGAASTPLSHAVFGFFENGGSECYVVNLGERKSVADGLELLELIDDIAIVAAPGQSDVAAYAAILGHCERLQDRFAILDAPERVESLDALIEVAKESAPAGPEEPAGARKKGLRAPQSDRGFGAYYFPWLRVRDPLAASEVVSVPPSGHLAGIYARTDATRGVFKAPANEPVRGALGLTRLITRAQQARLNVNGVNCIRFFPQEGIRVWGARTLAPAASEWRYVPVRRLFNMVEESIKVGTRWVVFEPNDQTLWKSIRRDVGAFLMRLWRSGALMGATPEQAFFVKCDAETNPPDVIDAGQVVTLVGIAPVKPAEFIVFRIGQHVAADEKGGTNA